MARYDVYRLRDGRHVLDVQSDFVYGTKTRTVVPLQEPADVPDATPHLHPRIKIDTRELTIMTHLIAAVPEAGLKEPIANLDDHSDAITRA
ncbi:CcdB family protein [Jannaschia sp. LMIT008]|uniref:CcdB family protein n=1 Tax=Jannaschia maritima TaxID=3032585 RepID=UPI0028125098|nr:CcdB family protein [Jannaschia sp. LMIT008]